MAEPTAGCFRRAGWPPSRLHSCAVVEAVDDHQFTLVLHNCAAKLIIWTRRCRRVPSVSFGAPMDLPAALTKAPPEVILAGNLILRRLCALDPGARARPPAA